MKLGDQRPGLESMDVSPQERDALCLVVQLWPAEPPCKLLGFWKLLELLNKAQAALLWPRSPVRFSLRQPFLKSQLSNLDWVLDPSQADFCGFSLGQILESHLETQGKRRRKRSPTDSDLSIWGVLKLSRKVVREHWHGRPKFGNNVFKNIQGSLWFTTAKKTQIGPPVSVTRGH